MKVLKEWDYTSFHVKNMHCGKCNINYNAYYYQGKLNHIINNSFTRMTKLQKRSKVINYLMTHSNADVREITDALHFPEIDVLSILSKLEVDGIVDRVMKNENEE